MDLRFQPSLIQEVIDAFIEKTEREGDPTFYKEFHELADPIYENFPLDDREPEFQKLYQYLFGHWGFADIIDHAFDELPELKGRIGITLVRGVLKEDQESVDILRKWGTVEEDLAKQFESRASRESGSSFCPGASMIRRCPASAVTSSCTLRTCSIRPFSMTRTSRLGTPLARKVSSWPGIESCGVSRSIVA